MALPSPAAPHRLQPPDLTSLVPRGLAGGTELQRFCTRGGGRAAGRQGGPTTPLARSHACALHTLGRAMCQQPSQIQTPSPRTVSSPKWSSTCTAFRHRVSNTRLLAARCGCLAYGTATESPHRALSSNCCTAAPAFDCSTTLLPAVDPGERVLACLADVRCAALRHELVKGAAVVRNLARHLRQAGPGHQRSTLKKSADRALMAWPPCRQPDCCITFLAGCPPRAPSGNPLQTWLLRPVLH